MGLEVPFLVDSGVGAAGADGIGADATVMLPVESTELNETHLALRLLLVIVFVL